MSDVRQRLKTDLAAIRTAIAAGRLEEAKRMIAAVPLNAPPSSELSREIGGLYLDLGFPVMAGRYWYLLEDKSDQMIAACDEFERSLGANPVLISKVFGWVRNVSPHAKAKLLDIHNKAMALRREHQYEWKPQRGWRDRVALVGCALVGFVVMFIFVMGICFIINLVGDGH
jgi:hypothetical protein